MNRFQVIEEQPAWGRDDRLWRPDLPVVWLTLGLATFGAVVLQSRVSGAFVRELPSSSLATVAWFLYAVPFVAVVAWFDLLEPEPPTFLATAFAWGALVATPVALVANQSGQAIVAEQWGAAFGAEWSGALVAPVTEEVMKALGVVLVILVARRQLTTVLDGIVYGAFVGLGLQVAENFLYTTDSLRAFLFGREAGEVVVDVFIGRGLELGLWSHTVYTAMAGFGIAYAVVEAHRSLTRRAAVATVAFLGAVGLHSLWNAPFTQVSPDASSWEEFGVYALKGLPALALVVALAAFAQRREVAWFAGALGDEDPAIVPAEEREALRTRRSRRAMVATAAKSGGRAAARAARRLQVAQVDLAMCKALDAEAETLAGARTEVRAAREALKGCTNASVSATTPPSGRASRTPRGR